MKMKIPQFLWEVFNEVFSCFENFFVPSNLKLFWHASFGMCNWAQNGICMLDLMYYSISWLLWLLDLVFIAMVNGEMHVIIFLRKYNSGYKFQQNVIFKFKQDCQFEIRNTICEIYKESWYTMKNKTLTIAFWYVKWM
jgi:hypothetical protein